MAKKTKPNVQVVRRKIAKVKKLVDEIIDEVSEQPPDPPPPTNEIRVRAGDDLQKAVDAAPEGSVLLVDPVEFRLNLKLRKMNVKPITIKSSANPSNFTNRKNRFGYVDPEMREAMPKLIPGDKFDYVAFAEEGSGGYKFQNICFPPHLTYDRTLVGLGSPNSSDPNTVPVGFDFDGCVLGNENPETKGHRGIEANCAYLQVIGCFIAGMAEPGRDSQAIGGWNGPGPFLVEHSFLQASGENVMFGGARCASAPRAPKGLTCRFNHFHKPLEWKDIPDVPSVKNLYETKNLLGLLLEYNLFENCWSGAQAGYPILIKAAAYGEDHPVRAHQHIIRFNVVRNAPGFLSVNNAEGSGPNDGVKGLLVEHNLGIELGLLPGDMRTIIMSGGLSGVEIHNNAFWYPKNNNTSFLTMYGNQPINGLRFLNNFLPEGEYGIHAEFVGIRGFQKYAQPGEFRRNVIRKGGHRDIDYGPENTFGESPTEGVGPNMVELKSRVPF